MNKIATAHAEFESAWMPVVEQLEERRLFAVDTVQTLPFVLDFNANQGDSLLDKDGEGIGFTRVQANKNGNEYQPALLDLDTAAGVLKVTTSGSSTIGSNTDGNNTLVNALETQFNATTSGFKITARILGPLNYISQPAQQAGIFFGADQDNYVKLVAVAQAGNTHIQFMDEQKSGTGYTHALGFNTLIQQNFASITTLDLQLVGDAATGKVQAYFAINGGAFQKFTQELTLSGTKKDLFFSATGRAGIIAMHKNDLPPITATFDQFKIEAGTAVAARPSVTAARVGGIPVPTISPVPRDSFIAADVSLPTAGAGVDTATLNSNSVKLYRTSDHAPVAAVLNTSGGGDAIVLTPTEALEPGINYTFEVTDQLKDTSGASFVPYTVSFTTNTQELQTDPTLAFQKVALPTATGHTYTGVTFGPDGKLYASTIDGLIQRFTVNGDGTLGTPQNITSLQNKEGGQTMLIGMAFAPGYNPANPASLTLWVTHNQYTDINAPVADDFTGRISKLTGANLQTVTTMVVNLPRSVRDHLTNQLTFGPDGAIYFNQGANTAMGAPDNAWGLRSEHLLTAAILRLDPAKLPTNGTALDVKTFDVPGGTYDPFNANNALTLYATGVRNAYDLVWTTSGRLFAPTNGSAAGGSTPGTPTGSYSFGANSRIDYLSNGAYTGPDVVGITNLQQTQNDYLFNVVKGGYYGNPNPARGEFVLNGGNPTSGSDGATEVSAYPIGTQPDRNYRGKNSGLTSKTMGSAYSFGKNYSPNGIIEYNGTAFGGALKGKLLVAEYSGGDDIVILTPDSNGNILSAKRGIAGLTHFTDPLDLIEDPNTGYLYVAEFGGQRLTLVRPIAPGANIETDKSQMVFNDTTATGASAVQKIKITNTGTSPLALPADGLEIVAANSTEKARFNFVDKPAAPYAEIAPGDSLEVQITFNAGATAGVIHTASLQIKSNDEDQTTLLIPLRGLAMSSLAGGTNEPSLQRIMDLYRIPINVGDPDKNTTELEFPLVSPNDEVLMQTLQKVGSGPVTIESLAVFGVGSSTVPTFRFGYYTPGNPTDTTELLKVTGSGSSISNSQTVNPNIVGTTSFDPGAGAFGLYTWWQNFSGQPRIYSEDALNKSYDADTPHKVRFYRYKTPDGVVVPDAFVFTFEEFNNATDQQDYVGIIRNVKAAEIGSGAEIGLENLDGPSFSNHLLFNRIQDPINNPPTVPNNIVHDKAVLRVRNTGTSALNVSSIVTSAGWVIEGLSDTTPTIAAGGSIDVTVRFTANPGGTTGKVVNGTLTINSNDADEPATTVTLSGWWQPENENNKEPSLQQMFAIMGYKTIVAHPGETLGQGNGGRIGDEVRSAYWNRADTTLPVSVRQLTAWHGQGATERFGWHLKTSGTVSTLFTHDGDEGQSFLPHLNNATIGVVGTGYAAGTFSPSATFGFKIGGDGTKAWSDPLRNTSDQWEVRLWAARDQGGKIIPNAYLMTMDYFGTSGTNYDFNDNVYLITNIKPESGPSAPTGLTAVASGAGVALNWNDNTEANLAGYNVYRASSAGGTYAKLNTGALLDVSEFVDVTAPVGQTSWYVVRAVDNVGNESGNNAAVSATRTSDTTPPAIPKSFTAVGSSTGIALNWADNSEGDFLGYNLYRATSPDGPWTKLNTDGLLGSSLFNDNGAPANVTSYYRVTAVDKAGNESAPAAASATRQSSDTTPPAKPTGLTAVGSGNGITLDWADTNTESDFLGYNVYRIDGGVPVKLNATGVLGVSQFIDTGAPAGVASTYEVRAVDTSGNESDAATASATRPADTTPPAAPTGVVVNVSTSGIALDWNNNTEGDLAGYNVYRATASGGPWAKLNASPIGASAYNDTTASGGQVSYYQIKAVDASGNESAPASASGTRPTSDTFPPATPAGLTAVVVATGIQLDWADNIESDLAGYNVYRANSAGGTYVKINTSGLVTASAFLDTTAPSGTSYYRVGAVDQAGNESGFAEASVTRTSSYTHVQIGNPTPTGSITTIKEGSDYDLKAGGADIWGTSDSFGFNYRQVSGDFDMRVRVAGLTNTHAWAKAGLMARESLVANSRNVFALVSAASGHGVTARTTTGGTSTIRGSGAATFPNNWLRLERVGNVFTGYRSTDGTNWTAIGSVTLALPSTIFFGIAATSHNTGALTTAQFRDLAVTGSTPVDEPPAAPKNVTTSPSTSGIALNWDDNTESDLAGYNVYRATSASGPWTKLNGSLLTSSAYNDTTAPSGVQSFYRIAAVDTAAQESAFALASATRPNAPSLPAGPFRINFQVAGSPGVAGYIQDNGAAFGDRGSGVQYGWNVSHTDWARDRNRNADQLLDTLVHMKAGSNWSIAIANGTYDVKIGVGDSQYATTNTINVNGVNFWTNQALGTNAFANKTMRVTVADGKLVVNNGASADLTTRINYIEITPAPTVTAPTKINFQLAGSPAVAGYLQDNGNAFGARNGLNYGWNGSYSDDARDRNRNSNQLLDTLMHMRTGASWSIDLADGAYDVKLSIGDAQYASVHNLAANGVSVFSNVSLAANVFQQKTVRVNVTNGKLTLTTSGADRATRINYIEITKV